jgi:hypothetical protein
MEHAATDAIQIAVKISVQNSSGKWPSVIQCERWKPPHYWGFAITLRYTTVGTTPLDEWSAQRRDLYLTTHSIQKRQTSMHPAGFETTIPANERQQTHALDRAVTGIGTCALLHSVTTNGSLLAFYPIVVSRRRMKPSMLTVVYFSILQHKLGIWLSHGITQVSL